jgi:hypothetical protein
MISKKFLITLLPWTGALLCLFFLSACLDDEEQVRELRQLREKLSSLEKKAAESAKEAETARSELSAAASAAPTDNGMAQRLQESQQRISDLEARLAAAQQQPAEAAAKPAEAAGSFRNQARQVQENLMKQMGVLSDSLQARHTGPSLEEITVKKIQSGFRSEIVFSVLGGDGQLRKLSFPVEADLEGHWNLPSLEVIAAHLGAAPSQNPPPQPVLAQTTAPPAPAPVANVPASPRPAAETIVIQWDQTPGRPSVAAAPATTTPPPAATAPAMMTPPPAAAPKALPKPIMPVTKDVQIRFD